MLLNERPEPLHVFERVRKIAFLGHLKVSKMLIVIQVIFSFIPLNKNVRRILTFLVDQ